MACTGIEFCKLAIVETKARAAELVDELEERLADVTSSAPITIHVNGCPNSCARIQVADIGLKGQIVTDADGNQVEGFQVHLGGGLGLDAGFGRKLRGLKVTGAELADYVERVVRRFVEQRDRGRAVRPVGRPRGRGGDLQMSRDERARRAVLLPVLRRRGPASAEDEPHGAWECAACLRVFTAEVRRDRSCRQ